MLTCLFGTISPGWVLVLRKTDQRLQILMHKKNNYSLQDQNLLIEIMADAIEGIIPRYRKLHELGQIELSMTPYGHPIVPLLIDYNTMHDAMPDAPTPKSTYYPDGYNRAKWHMQHGLDIFNNILIAYQQEFGYQKVLLVAMQLICLMNLK